MLARFGHFGHTAWPRLLIHPRSCRDVSLCALQCQADTRLCQHRHACYCGMLKAELALQSIHPHLREYLDHAHIVRQDQQPSQPPHSQRATSLERPTPAASSPREGRPGSSIAGGEQGGLQRAASDATEAVQSGHERDHQDGGAQDMTGIRESDAQAAVDAHDGAEDAVHDAYKAQPEDMDMKSHDGDAPATAKACAADPAEAAEQAATEAEAQVQAAPKGRGKQAARRGRSAGGSKQRNDSTAPAEPSKLGQRSQSAMSTRKRSRATEEVMPAPAPAASAATGTSEDGAVAASVANGQRGSGRGDAPVSTRSGTTRGAAAGMSSKGKGRAQRSASVEPKQKVARTEALQEAGPSPPPLPVEAIAPNTSAAPAKGGKAAPKKGKGGGRGGAKGRGGRGKPAPAAVKGEDANEPGSLAVAQPAEPQAEPPAASRQATPDRMTSTELNEIDAMTAALEVGLTPPPGQVLRDDDAPADTAGTAPDTAAAQPSVGAVLPAAASTQALAPQINVAATVDEQWSQLNGHLELLAMAPEDEVLAEILSLQMELAQVCTSVCYAPAQSTPSPALLFVHCAARQGACNVSVLYVWPFIAVGLCNLH